MLVKSLFVAAALASGISASAEAASPYQQVCNGNTCLYHSHHLNGGVLKYYVSVGASPITHFNIRYKSGLSVVQKEIEVSGRFSKISTFRVKPGTSYEITIQACYSRFLSPSSCSAWRTVRFTAPS